jgi:ABC-type dipeptide/oligopeptide/nickel transport system permease component
MLRRYVLGRVLAGVIGMIAFLTVVFFGVRLLVPGDFADNFALQGPGIASTVREELGLNRPIWDQYLIWMGRTLSFNLGRTPRGSTVTSELLAALPWTLTMFALGLAAAFLVGVRVGRWAGWRKRSNTPTTLGAATITSIFPPWLVFLAFYFGLNLLGFRMFNDITAFDYELWEGGLDRSTVLWQVIWTSIALGVMSFAASRLFPEHQRRGVGRSAFVVDLILLPVVWTAMGIRSHAYDILLFLLLPALVLFFLAVGDVVLVIAASMDGLAEKDFSLTAKAKGLTDHQVRDRHAGKVALLPAISRMTANLPFALGGLVIIEASFARLGGYRIPIPGVASVLFGSLRERDLVVVMGGLVAIGLLTLLLRIGLDLAVAKLDPRVQLEKVVVRA